MIADRIRTIIGTVIIITEPFIGVVYWRPLKNDNIFSATPKNAAATKKLAIFDAFEILNRIQEEENLLEDKPKEEQKKKTFAGFAEKRSK